VAVSTDDIEAGLRSGETLSGKLVREYGFQLAEMDAAARDYFNVAQGLWVREVRNGSAAAGADIEPGDIITAFGGRPVAALDDLALLGAGVLPTEPALTILSGGKPRAVLLSRRAAAALPVAPNREVGIRLESPAKGLRVGSVLPESPAYQAGLRPGDRIVRIGAKRNPDEKDFTAAFAPGRSEPVFLVYERNAVERGALLAP
jgi:serine protease Do